MTEQLAALRAASIDLSVDENGGVTLPTYEYLCAACGRQYEKREGFDAPARQKCQFCGKHAQRVLFAPPVVFKGSGFYKTDNRGSSSDDGAAASETATPAAAAASDHGHSHGPGGHSHGETSTPKSDSKSDAPSTPASTESAAAS
jgi:putative FmdB family regulatory protein